MGIEIPYNPKVDKNHKCKYCGSKIKKGTTCKNCGAPVE